MAVGMININNSAFSPDIKYYASITAEGKLKIWDTENNALKQEFTPNLHLSSPCTCLQWIKHTKEHPQKKKRKSADKSFIAVDQEEGYTILLGTNDGSVLLYSFNEGKITGTLGEAKTGHSGSITCIAYERGDFAYSCADDSTIIEWCLKSRRKSISWSAGKEFPTSLLLISQHRRLFSAARTIQMWCLKNKTLLKSFTGHSSIVSIMKSVTIANEDGENDTFVVTGGRNDRILNAWNISGEIKDKMPYASFQMEDIAYSLSIDFNSQDNGLCLTAVTRSGVLHFYKHILNGRLSKPVKPKLTLQVVFDKQNSSNNKIQSIPILTGHVVNEDLILIGYGTYLNMTFEKIKPQAIGKIQVLVRQDPYSSAKKLKENIEKTKVTETQDVEYLGPSSGHIYNLKRSSGKKIELPMESRLENLSLAVDSPTKGLPKYDNMSHLLIQGLHSKDKNILQGVLMKKDEKIIQNTISRLPVQYLIPLIRELTSYIHGKTLSSQIGTMWFRILLQSHAAHLMSVGSETLVEILSPCLGLIENRLNLLQPLSRLQGRLDLLINQISTVQDQCNEEYTEKNLLVFQDPDSSESESDEIAALQSSSDDNWDEVSDEEQDEEMVIDANNTHEITSESD